jgi:hypothetical protein
VDSDLEKTHRPLGRDAEEPIRGTDLEAAARKRRQLGFAFAGVFGAVNAALDLAERSAGLGHLGYLFWIALTALALAVPTVALRRALFPDRVSRRLGWSLALVLLGQGATFCALMVLNVPLRQSLAVTLFALGSIALVEGVWIGRRMVASALLAWALGIAALFAPPVAFYAVAVAYGALFVGGALLGDAWVAGGDAGDDQVS